MIIAHINGARRFLKIRVSPRIVSRFTAIKTKIIELQQHYVKLANETHCINGGTHKRNLNFTPRHFRAF